MGNQKDHAALRPSALLLASARYAETPWFGSTLGYQILIHIHAEGSPQTPTSPKRKVSRFTYPKKNTSVPRKVSRYPPKNAPYSNLKDFSQRRRPPVSYVFGVSSPFLFTVRPLGWPWYRIGQGLLGGTSCLEGLMAALTEGVSAPSLPRPIGRNHPEGTTKGAQGTRRDSQGTSRKPKRPPRTSAGLPQGTHHNGSKRPPREPTDSQGTPKVPHKGPTRTCKGPPRTPKFQRTPKGAPTNNQRPPKIPKGLRGSTQTNPRDCERGWQQRRSFFFSFQNSYSVTGVQATRTVLQWS